MLKPTGDRILLEVIPQKEPKKGEESYEPTKGKIVAVGPDIDYANFTIDDIVIYDARFGGDVVGKNLIIIREGSALAIE